MDTSEGPLLLVGLQGMMKAVIASNVWDECGYANLSGFHTYWLRRLLDRLQAWERLVTYRQQVPWHTRMLSNTLNGLLWRSAYIFQKYRYFLITESWVAPHFQALLAGLDRVGLHHQDITVYFEAHCTIDPLHGAELIQGFSQQQPALPQHDIDDVLRGAHLAIAAGVMQWDLLLPYLSHLA
jgi:heme oxygenase-like protein